MYHVEYFVTYQYLNLNISKCIVESTLTYGILLCVQALGHAFFTFAFYPLSLFLERERVLQQIRTYLISTRKVGYNTDIMRK